MAAELESRKDQDQDPAELERIRKRQAGLYICLFMYISCTAAIHNCMYTYIHCDIDVFVDVTYDVTYT